LIDALLENVTGGMPLSCSFPRPLVPDSDDQR
jgi:hypothetical protein